MSTYCKYYKQQKQVSYDSGQTWSNVVPAEYQVGDFYEEGSPDCDESTPIYRYVLVPGGFICEGKDKYEKEILQYSIDNGVTYSNVYPTVFRKGRLIESNSDICDNKWEGHYYGHLSVAPRDPVKYILCSTSTSTTLTTSDTNYQGYTLMSGIIGDCVTSIGQSAFSFCSGLTSITISDTVTSFENYAFRYCNGLTSIDIPSGVTSIGDGAFDNCTRLTSLDIPSGVTIINNRTFLGCSSLARLDFSDNITSIGDYACASCSTLLGVTIGSGITSIGDYAFTGCTNLTGITINATTPPTLENNAVFDNTNNCPIYVPSSSVNTYKAASRWSNYASRIQAIP